MNACPSRVARAPISAQTPVPALALRAVQGGPGAPSATAGWEGARVCAGDLWAGRGQRRCCPGHLEDVGRAGQPGEPVLRPQQPSLAGRVCDACSSAAGKGCFLGSSQTARVTSRCGRRCPLVPWGGRGSPTFPPRRRLPGGTCSLAPRWEHGCRVVVFPGCVYAGAGPRSDLGRGALEQASSLAVLSEDCPAGDRQRALAELFPVPLTSAPAVPAPAL